MLKEIYFWSVYFMKRNKKDNNPEFNALFLNGLLLGFNSITLLKIIVIVLNFDIKKLINENNYVLIGVMYGMFILLICYFYLYKKRKVIYAKYEHMPLKRQMVGKIYYWCCLLITLPLFYYVSSYFQR